VLPISCCAAKKWLINHLSAIFIKREDGIMQPFLDQILKWPAIIQGALGSALFWVLQTLFITVGKYFLRRTNRYSKKLSKESLIREWIYRKYYSRNGLVNLTQGFIITFDHIFQYLIRGLIFIVIGLLLSGVSQIFLGIFLVAALYYLLRAFLWLNPSAEWSQDSNYEHWKRISEIEKVLMGRIEPDTQECVERFSKECVERNN
jgi:hypothetical protein